MLRAYCGLVTHDYTEWIVTVQKHVVYLGRYAPGLGVNSCGIPTEQWPMGYLLAQVKMVSEIVSQENKAGKPNKSFGPPK